MTNSPERRARHGKGQLGAAVAAIKEKGVLSGKRIERSEVGSPGEFDHLTDDELERALIERLAQLGFAPVAISNGSIAKAPGHVSALQAATSEARWLWLKDELTKYGNQAYWGMFPELAEFFRARPFVGAVA